MVSVSLLEEIAATPPVKGPRCSVAAFIDGLAPDDAADLRTAFDSAYMTSAIYRALRKRFPSTPNENTLARHRRGACSCP
jgi:hypothetical protein